MDHLLDQKPLTNMKGTEKKGWLRGKSFGYFQFKRIFLNSKEKVVINAKIQDIQLLVE